MTHNEKAEQCSTAALQCLASLLLLVLMHYWSKNPRHLVIMASVIFLPTAIAFFVLLAYSVEQICDTY